MYGLVTIVNNTVVYVEVAKRADLKISHRKRKQMIAVGGDGC